MSQISMEQLRSLLSAPRPPCISIYQPTHRRHPENRQDPIRFKNLVRSVEDSLRQKYPTRDVREFLTPLQGLAGKASLWNHARDGLAVLLAAEIFEVFQLQRSVPELAIVADSFHLKPLFRYVQSADRFQVLALTRDRAWMLEGNRYVLDVETLPDDFPTRRDQVVPPEPSQAGVSVASSSAGVGSPKMMRGHGIDKEDLDTEKFFRAVDRAVTAQFSKPTGLPLVLAALAEHQGIFRKLSQNPMLLPAGVEGNPEPMTPEDLRQRVWKIFEPHYLARLEQLKENFRNAHARQAGSADLADVARAAVAGRVGTLLVEADRVIPGVLNRTDGSIRFRDLASPDVDDLLDDLAEVVAAARGEVVVVPADRMPGNTGLAAIYRY